MEELKITETDIRYAINKSIGRYSPIWIAFKLITSGRIWIQDIIIKEIKKELRLTPVFLGKAQGTSAKIPVNQ